MLYHFGLGVDELYYFETAAVFPDNTKLQILNVVDLGFDVWTNSFRGSRYNQRHVTLDNQSAEFWNFSLDEFAAYDLPKAVDYVYR